MFSIHGFSLHLMGGSGLICYGVFAYEINVHSPEQILRKPVMGFHKRGNLCIFESEFNGVLKNRANFPLSPADSAKRMVLPIKNSSHTSEWEFCVKILLGLTRRYLFLLRLCFGQQSYQVAHTLEIPQFHRRILRKMLWTFINSFNFLFLGSEWPQAGIVFGKFDNEKFYPLDDGFF